MIDRLLPDGPLSARARLAWTWFFRLAPVALVLGLWLIASVDPRARLGVTIDRDTAIASARQLAASAGVDASHWGARVRAAKNPERSFYFRLPGVPERARARRVVPELVVEVRLRSTVANEVFEAYLTPDGHPLGFERYVAESTTPPDVGEARSRSIAQQAAAAWAGASGFDLGAPVHTEHRDGTDVTHEFVFPLPAAALPELTLTLRTAVHGDTLVRRRVDASIAQDFSRQHLSAPPTQLRWVQIPLFVLFYVIVIIAGLYRYIVRSRQKEAPHARTLIVACVVAVIVVVFGLFFEGSENDPTSSNSIWIQLILIIVVVVIFSGAVGMAWGSGEGDLRELFPGRLTSLDALILGKFLSMNVSRATLVGFAFASWLLLTYGVVLGSLGWRPNMGMGIGEVNRLWEPLMGVLAFFDAIVSGVVAAAMVLLVPLPVFRRAFKSDAMFVAALTAASLVFAGSFLPAGYRPLPLAFLFTVLAAAALLVPFFTHDLLAAIVGTIAFEWLLALLAPLLQQVWSIRIAGVVTAGAALLVLAAASVILVRGRRYTEEEVRPVYAANLAERLGLQAEVAAAREAQLRLLPRVLPQVRGVSVSASCRPAREVGGDFYDVYRVDDSTLGVFVADGGGRAVDAALVIALAKGFLMPTARTGLSPTDLMTRLHALLAPLLDKDQGGGFLYALVAAGEGRISYARWGSSPTVLVKSPARSQAVRPEETSISVASKSGDVALLEGSCQLAPGDHIIVVTDGVDQVLEAVGVPSIGAWVASILASSPAGAAPAHDALMRAFTRCSRSARAAGVQDDVTTVVLQMETMPAAAASAVA